MPYQDPYLVTLSLGAFLPPSLAKHPHKTHILAHLETERKKILKICIRGRHRPRAMDHQHHQPIWPLLEGAFDYTMNLASELWTMIWRPAEQPRTQPMSAVAAQSSQIEVARVGSRPRTKRSGDIAKACAAAQREVER